MAQEERASYGALVVAILIGLLANDMITGEHLFSFLGRLLVWGLVATVITGWVVSFVPTYTRPKWVRPLTSVKVPQRVDEKMRRLLEKVLSVYVYPWYSYMTSDEAFVDSIRDALRITCNALVCRISEIDLVMYLEGPVLDVLIAHTDAYMAAKHLSVAGEGDVVDLMMTSLPRGGHVAVSSSQAELEYLRLVLDRLLPLIAPRKLTCGGAPQTLLREVLANLVIKPGFDSLCAPATINSIIVTLLSPSAEPESPPTKKPSPSPMVSFLGGYGLGPERTKGPLHRSLHAILRSPHGQKYFSLFMARENAENLLKFFQEYDLYVEPVSEATRLQLTPVDLYYRYIMAGGPQHIDLPPNIYAKITDEVASDWRHWQAPEAQGMFTTLLPARDWVMTRLHKYYHPLFLESDLYWALLCSEKQETKKAASKSSDKKTAKKPPKIAPVGPVTQADQAMAVSDTYAPPRLRKVLAKEDTSELSSSLDVPPANPSGLSRDSLVPSAAPTPNITPHTTPTLPGKRRMTAPDSPKSVPLHGPVSPRKRAISAGNKASPLESELGRLEPLSDVGEEPGGIDTRLMDASNESMPRPSARYPWRDGSDCSKWRVSIVAAYEVKVRSPYVIYIIEVMPGDGESSWLAGRRYNEFRVLRHQLKGTGASLPDLPVRWIPTATRLALVTARIPLLTLFMQKVLESATCSRMDVVRQFLAPDKDLTAMPLSNVHQAKECPLFVHPQQRHFLRQSSTGSAASGGRALSRTHSVADDDANSRRMDNKAFRTQLYLAHLSFAHQIDPTMFTAAMHSTPVTPAQSPPESPPNSRAEKGSMTNMHASLPDLRQASTDTPKTDLPSENNQPATYPSQETQPFPSDESLPQTRSTSPNTLPAPPEPEKDDVNRSDRASSIEAARTAKGSSQVPQRQGVETSVVTPDGHEGGLVEPLIALVDVAFWRCCQAPWVPTLLRVLELLIAPLVNSFLRKVIWYKIGQLYEEKELCRTIDNIYDLLFPEAVQTPQTPEEIYELRRQAESLVADIFPDILQFLLGRRRVREDVSGLVEMLQHEKLNRQLVYCLLDVLLEGLFPEITDGGLLPPSRRPTLTASGISGVNLASQ